MQTKPIVLVNAGDIKPTIPGFRPRGAFNPSAVRLPNRKIMLFARIAETPKHGETIFLAPRFTGTDKMEITIDKIVRKKMEFTGEIFLTNTDIARLPTISHLRKIMLDETGTRVEAISEKPDFYGLKDDGDFGVEDPRITFFESEKRYAMTYVSVSMESGVSTSLATTSDLETWKREGIIFRQQNKDAVIFPEKIGDYYVALNRPEGKMVFDKPSIWLSYSKDLLFWGKDKPIMTPRKTGWDSSRIGAGTVPIKTSEGWLEIYHGVEEKEVDGEIHKTYCAGAVLLDINDHLRVLARTPSKEPLMEPELDCEKEGFVNRVVFPTAAIPDNNGGLLIYSGAADTSITLRKLKVKDILNSLETVKGK